MFPALKVFPMQIVFLWICSVLAVMVTGCETTGRHVQWYGGQPLSTNEIALLRLQRGDNGVYLHVNRINGERLDRAAEIELMPGNYQLSVAYYGIDGHSSADANISFTAEAGKTYDLRGGERKQRIPAAFGREWTIWILEAGTGKLVAGSPRGTPYEK
jgi:hypothetical protein